MMTSACLPILVSVVWLLVFAPSGIAGAGLRDNPIEGVNTMYLDGAHWTAVGGGHTITARVPYKTGLVCYPWSNQPPTLTCNVFPGAWRRAE